MSQLKEQNGKYYQECKVVMLATKKATNITKIYLNADKTKSILKINKTVNDNYKEYINLYILSDDEIKKGDWFIQADGGNGDPILRKFVSEKEYDETKYKVEYYPYCQISGFPDKGWGCKKIIATTDESLGLPKPSDSFIKKYIEEYNAGRQITNVLVEFDEYYKDEFIALEDRHFKDYYSEQGFANFNYRLKVDSDNIVAIKKLKDSYSREEVIELLSKLNHTLNISDKPEGHEITFETWIKENL